MNKINDGILQAINSILNVNCNLIDYDINNIENRFTTESEKLYLKITTLDFLLHREMFIEKKNGL